ncbi:MAG: type II toxin-antitoxin system VapB family antitoxin [Thermodesulfovibrionales bacterium]
MRATIDIDDKLIEEAKKLTAIKTKKELINLSLKELIRKKRIEHLISLFGTSPIDITLSDVEKFREDRKIDAAR